MKRALLIGIDHYDKQPLQACVADAKALASVLEKNEDGSRNYAVRVMTSDSTRIDRPVLRAAIADLFKNARDAELLFYFSGHGAESPWGAELVTQDYKLNSLGVSMNDLLTLANGSPATEAVIILDCCYSGDLGNAPGLQAAEIAPAFRLGKAVLAEGVTLLVGSRATEPSMALVGQSAFTQLLLEGLRGAAADPIGNVTALSLYDFTSRAFDAWEQRPVFKSHITRPTVLRRCTPIIDPQLIVDLPTTFPKAESRVRMSPAHEGTRPVPPGVLPTLEQQAFDYFKKLRNAGLLTTTDNKDLYFVAMDSDEVFLTPAGRYYWRLAKERKL